ncbi:MAG: D-aminoacylase [Sphaerochaetaceae bacterium]|jgi:N-acyl-D-aspartate/D-glutamate deacylase
MYDLVFSHAIVVDGTGAPPFVADVGVRDGRIATIGKIEEDGAIDVRGKILCPGFIDIHAHSELEVLRDPAMSAKVGQGVTSEVCGNCGVGVCPAPVDDSIQKSLNEDVLGFWDGKYWPSFASYLDRLSQTGTGTNMAFLVGHSALRCAAIAGNPNRVATDEEISVMIRLLEDAYRMGCVGFSTGLYYAPCMYADRRELTALLSTTARFDRLFSVHHRCEGDDVLPSLAEVISLAKETGVRLEISHLKAIGRDNQEKVGRMLEMIERAKRDGVRIGFDQYPYTYGSTSLYSLLPPDFLKLSRLELRKVLRDGTARMRMKEEMEHPDGWDSIVRLAGFDEITILALSGHPEYEMRTIADIAAQMGKDPFSMAFDLLADAQGVALMADTTQSEKSLIRILSHPLMAFGSDALYAGALWHPRSRNAAVHLLCRYGRILKVLPWETLVRKMTALAAERIGMTDRGLVAEGRMADLVVFDPRTIEDTATMDRPDAPIKGLSFVVVNGRICCRDGKTTGMVAGRPFIART